MKTTITLIALVFTMTSTAMAAGLKKEACFIFPGKDKKNHVGYVKIDNEAVSIIYGYKESESDYESGSSGLIERTSKSIKIASLFINPGWGDSYNMAIELTNTHFKVNYRINDDGTPYGEGKSYPLVECP